MVTPFVVFRRHSYEREAASRNLQKNRAKGCTEAQSRFCKSKSEVKWGMFKEVQYRNKKKLGSLTET